MERTKLGNRSVLVMAMDHCINNYSIEALYNRSISLSELNGVEPKYKY